MLQKLPFHKFVLKTSKLWQINILTVAAIDTNLTGRILQIPKHIGAQDLQTTRILDILIRDIETCFNFLGIKRTSICIFKNGNYKMMCSVAILRRYANIFVFIGCEAIDFQNGDLSEFPQPE